MTDTSLLRATLPTGATIDVLTTDEAEFIAERVDRYTTEYRLTNISDLAELDRIVAGEMFAQRYQAWLAQGHTYDSRPLDDVGLRKDLKDLSLELRQVKKALGIDKLNRDKQKGEGSTHQFLGNLLLRAKQFGVHRETQLDRALELVNELVGMVTFHRNATPELRKEFHATADDILDWIWDVMRVEYDAIDRHFRENVQRYWVREM